MCNVVWSFLGNIAQGFYLCNVVPRVLRQHWTEFFPKIERRSSSQNDFYGIESSKNAIKDLTIKKSSTSSFEYGLIFGPLIISNSY